MKRLIILSTIILVFFSSCVKNPYADFIADKTTVELGEVVYFTNISQDALDYEWDFDDGNYSANFNASHAWYDPGTYQVALTAFGKDGRMDIALMDIYVVQYYCDLEITVEEFSDPYIVPDARVRLYPTYDDWIDQTNMIVEGYTGTNGAVLFLDVPIPYPHHKVYVDVYGDYHDNYLLQEDFGDEYIATGILQADVRNYFTALVDYYPDGKKSVSDKKSTSRDLSNTPKERIDPALRESFDGVPRQVR